MSEAARALWCSGIYNLILTCRKLQKMLDIFFFFDKILLKGSEGGEHMGIYIIGLFINCEQRFKDGKTDGFNFLVAVSSEAYKIKVSDELYAQSGAAALGLGDKISASVKINVFRDKIYFSAESLEVVAE